MMQKSKTKVQADCAGKPQGRRQTARILMLHGYTQSGEHMRIKTRFLRSILENNVLQSSSFKEYYPDGFEFFYPTAPNPIRVTDDMEDDDEMWAWGLGDYTTTKIKHLDKSMLDILQLLQTEGPFVGIVGFSTGSTMALILASLAERGASAEVIEALKLNPKLLPLHPFKFGIMYSGCILSHSSYKSIFFPKIQTPILHFVGEYDTYIPRYEMLKFSERCQNIITYFHPGGHFIAKYKQCQAVTVEFVTEKLMERDFASMSRG